MPADRTNREYWILAIAALCVIAAVVLHFRGRVERTEKKEVQQTVKTEAVKKAASTTVKSQKIDTSGFTFDSGHAAKTKAKTQTKTRNVTRKRVTTTFDPTTGAPTSRTEEDLVVNAATNTATHSAAVASQHSTQAVQTQAASTAAAQTNEQARTTQEAIDRTTSETTTKPVQPERSRLGLAQTTAGKTGLTYDFARKGPFTASGIVTIDLKRGEVAGVGGGVNTDMWFRGKYFVGAYGVHDVRDGTNRVVGAIGYRF